MFKKLRKSIMAKLILQFFLVGIIPLIGMSALTYYLARGAIISEVLQNNASVNTIKKSHILEFIQDRMENLTLLARTQQIRNMVNNQTYQEMSPIFDYYMKVFGYSDILLMNELGQTVYSATGDKQNAPDGETGLKTEPAAKALWDKITDQESTMITDMVLPQFSPEPALFMGAPVYADTGEMYAVLVCRINASRIALMTQDPPPSQTQGDNAESQNFKRKTYIAGQDALLRTPSLQDGKNGILKARASARLVELAEKTSAGTLMADDVQGEKALFAYSLMGLKTAIGADFDWVIITSVSEQEAFSLLSQLQINTFMGLGVFIVLVITAGVVQSRMIARPITELSYRIIKVNQGDFSAEVSVSDERRTDEIGMLLKTFNEGSKRFRQQMKSLIVSTNLLVESISRISTTATQLATSASETSSSISEVTTTVEEVKQTSLVASEKAEYVAQSADATARISYAGKQSTQNTMKGIERIREEMNAIAESTVQLSAQTKSIEDIINTVSDIADQSNILSVNAAIEAAKAGEHGKGFSVVAQEVKSLANQSKEATNQVREILNDIQKATSTAVMATERGTKTVAQAIELSEQSGDAIDRLSSRVIESAEAAMQITASNQQQLSGMDQLSQAMESINGATQQNLEGVKQLEEAIKNLENMAKTLKNVTSSYKI